MKRILIAMATMALLTDVAVAAQGAPMGRGMSGPGMMGYEMPGSRLGYGPMFSGTMGSDMDCPMTSSGMMGRGSAGFDARYWSLDLSDTQRDKILAIERAASRKNWELMGKMHDQHLSAHESYAKGKWDEQALRKNYEVMSEVRKGMFETALQARKDIEAVLTREQRSQIGISDGSR